MNDITKILDIALNEVGYLEKASNKDLDSKTGNAGKSNYTKYARDLDNIPSFYNGKKNGYPWCDVFVDWCFVKAFGVEKAKELLCQPNRSAGAGCLFSMNYYKSKNQFHTYPQKGDQIFFKQNGSITHTGIVYNVDEKKVYTVEGNTSSASGVVANGGSVALKSYFLNSSYIAGYGRPKYENTANTGDTTTYKERVIELQTLLVKNGFSIGKSGIDGIFGNDTKKATTNAKIKKGSKGDLVKFTQKQLMRNGYSLPAYGSDGDFGNETHYAVIQFQESKNLTKDAWVGGSTMYELLK